MSKEAIAKAPRTRPTRQPVGLRNRLKVYNQDPNYQYRWVVDYDGTGDRIEQFKLAGYELAPEGLHRVGDSRLDVGGTEGTVQTLKVGGGQTAYLMRQDRTWFEEDQKEKQKRVDRTEQALKQPALDGGYGKVSIGNE